MRIPWSVLLALLWAVSPLALAVEPGGPSGGVTVLADRADAVVVGQCTEVRSEWNADRTVIHTYVTYDVVRGVKGPGSVQRITLRELGGTVGNITQTVVGGPTFEVGGRDLLFLAEDGRTGYYRTYALSQGKVPIRTDPESGRQVALAVVAGPDPSGAAPSPRASMRRPVDLDGLIKTIERHLATAGGGTP